MRKLLKQTLALATSVAMCLSVASPVLTVYAEDATAPTTDSYVDAGDTADVSPFDSIAAPDTSDTDTEAANAEAANVEAADTEAADTEPADAETTDTEAANTEAADTEAADTEAADTEPADAETTDTEAANTEAADTETADAEPSAQEPEAQPAEPATPETTAEPLTVLNPENPVTTANVGDTVTLSVDLNREDVEVTYQWQVMRQPAAAEIEPVYQYAEDAPTWYNYPLEDKSEADLLVENPAATWQGMETYLAVVDALDEIGEDSTAASLAWRTENYALEGYAIHAANVDGQVQIYADKGDTRYTATLNSENKWEFDATEGSAAYSWQDIEGATDSRFSFEVTAADYRSSYRCAVTVTDADYLAQCAEQLTDNGTELTNEQLAADQVLYSLVMTVESPEAATPETAAVEDIALYAATGSSTTPHLSADAQWIEGLNNNFEYITKDTYDRISQWLAEGKIDDSQAKRYWTGLFGWKQTASANVLDADGFPTGELRTYFGVTLTNGALEVNSEWYGKTVYFRVHGSTGTGTAVNIPAYTDLTVDSDGNYVESSAGTKYKKAVTFLNPFVPDTGSMYSNFLSAVSTDGWLLNMDGSGNFTTPSDIHIRVYTVNCESFNSDPARYMVDAEGNYRMDSVGWGVCTSDEPDLSGKAYWQLKDYIANGYGFLTGHDTLYAYAGAYYDAYGTDLDESSIDPNDGTTWYYSLNSWLPYGTTKDGQTSEQRGGHFYMNQLMGSNKGNVNSGTVSPSDAPGLILSTGGSHGVYGKNIQYGSESIHVAQTGYSAAQALQNPKYRTPTNYPYSFAAGQVFPASFTHTNQQAAFGTIWADYSGGNKAAELYGYYTDPRYWTINNQVGTNNFYLSGNGNYLMNQIGHLPTNAAYSYESALFANSVMYVSQRKQCEICAANQSGQETVHFVRRISSTNFKAVTDALRSGGSYWYPLDGCYMLTEDVTLPEDWTPIAGFTGHWNSDVYKVTLNSKGTPLLANTSADGPTGWNLGTDPAKGTPNVFDANMTRTTGVARVLGDLNDLFGTNTSYAGYVVKILGSDNPAYMQSSEVYSCTVNSDSKYVISNLPCIYESAGKGVLFARVYDRNNREVTEYGDILVNVSTSYWFNCETTPLYLGNFESFPTNDYTTYESAQGIFESYAVSSSKFEAKKWQYRENNTAEWKDVPSDWDTSVKTTVHDPAVAGSGVDLYTVTTKLTLKQVKPSWDGYQFRAVYSNGKATWNSFGYYFKGAIASNESFDGAVYKEINEPGKTGTLRVKLWPAYAEQGSDAKINEASSATFRAYGYALSDGTQISVSWQYGTLNRIENGKPIYDWKDVSSGNEFGGLQKISTSSPVRGTRPEIDAALLGVAKDNDLDLFHKSAKFYGVESKLTVRKVDIDQTNYHFRAHFTAKSKNGTSYDWYSDIADETAGVYTTSDGNFATHGVKVKKDNSNKLTVIPPDIRAVTTPSASFNEGKSNPDLMTPDEYGQTLLLPTVSSTLCNGTAAYQTILYYKAKELAPTPTWQYMTYTDRRARNWDQNVARSLGYSNITVRVQNSAPFDAVYKGESGWKAIKSTMYISNAPITMYNSENLLKYYFRCIGTMNYETVRRQKSLSAADKWGGLSMDYAIAIWHNGVIGYNNTNKINGSTVTDSDGLIAATKNRSYSDWYYPKLAIKVPAGHHVNTVIVSFENMSSSDSILVDTGSLNRLGITVSQASSSYVVLVSGAKDRVETSTWQNALQNYVGFRSYDKVNYSKAGIQNGTCGGATVKWLVDENRLAGVTYDPDSGHFYKVVDMGNDVSWETARQRAATYDSELGMSGYLAEIGSAKENAIVHNLVGGRNAWLGGTRSGNWWHWNNSNSWFGYSNWQSGAQTGNANLFMTPSGTWNSGPVSVTNTVTVPAWQDTSNVLVKVQHSADNSNNWEHTNYEDYSKEIFIPENYRGRTATFLIDYWQAWFFTGGCSHSVISKYEGKGYSGFSLSVEGWYDGGWHRIAGEWSVRDYEDKYSYPANLRGDGRYYHCIDLTIPSNVTWIRTKIQGDGCSQHLQTAVNVFCNGWTKTVTGYSNPCTAAVIEYEPQALAFATTDHSATDTTVIGTNASSTIVTNSKIVSANIKGNTKVYDGKPISPSSFVVTGSTTGANASLFNVRIDAAEAGNNAGYATRNVNGANYTDTEAVNATRYHVTVSLTQEAINAGWQLDESQSSLECDLIINQRPIDVYSYHNDKTYDGTTTGTISGITFRGASGDKGVVNGDSVRLNTTTVSGTYIDKNGSATIHNSVSNNSNKEYTMSRNAVVSTLAIVHDSSSDPHYNYILGNEDYTGAITPRPVTVHSLYLDNPEQPRNVKTYDGTDKATIRDIILDNVLGDAVTLKDQVMTGTYATAEAGETLNPDGTPQTDRLKKLTENVITADTHAELQGDTYGDYYIAEEKYSGAISRALLEVHTKSERKMYGAADIEPPWFIRDFDAKSTGSVDGWLSITGLEGKDTLHLEDSYSFGVTDKDGNIFTLDSTTPVGVYPVTVGSLTEADYPVLRNYIVAKYDGVAEIYPREIVVTPTDLDWYVEDDGTPTPFAKFELLNDDEKSYTNLGTDADTDYTAMPLIGSDTVASVLGLYRDSSLAAYTEYDKRSVFGKESNISYSTEWYSHAPAIYLDVENDPTLEPCAWCENRHGFAMGTDHWKISGYVLRINQNADEGSVLTVAAVQNPLGETVQNYTLRYVDGLLRVHPKLRFQLKATVPMYVCMYGYAGDGSVVTPTNYGITNLSNGAIKVTDLTISQKGSQTVGWNIVDKDPQTLQRGEMTMHLNGLQLTMGSNTITNPEKWRIPADTQQLLPLTCYIAGGNVNDRQESYVTSITYTVAEYGVTVPEVDGVEIPDTIHGEPVTKTVG